MRLRTDERHMSGDKKGKFGLRRTKSFLLGQTSFQEGFGFQ